MEYDAQFDFSGHHKMIGVLDRRRDLVASEQKLEGMEKNRDVQRYTFRIKILRCTAYITTLHPRA